MFGVQWEGDGGGALPFFKCAFQCRFSGREEAFQARVPTPSKAYPIMWCQSGADFYM